MARKTISDVVNRAITDYGDARYCLEALRKIGRYKDEKIGVVSRDLLCNGQTGLYLARAGQVVIYWGETDGDKVVIAKPDTIKETKRKMWGGLGARLGLSFYTNILPIKKRWVREVSE